MKKKMRLFPHHQIARQGDFLHFTTFTINIVILSHIVIKLSDKSATNPGRSFGDPASSSLSKKIERAVFNDTTHS
jgi:hypothetical protein